MPSLALISVPHLCAFPLGSDRQPASKRAGILDFIQVARELSVTIDIPQPGE
jgi:hypothetical protein